MSTIINSQTQLIHARTHTHSRAQARSPTLVNLASDADAPGPVSVDRLRGPDLVAYRNANLGVKVPLVVQRFVGALVLVVVLLVHVLARMLPDDGVFERARKRCNFGALRQVLVRGGTVGPKRADRDEGGGEALEANGVIRAEADEEGLVQRDDLRGVLLGDFGVTEGFSGKVSSEILTLLPQYLPCSGPLASSSPPYTST